MTYLCDSCAAKAVKAHFTRPLFVISSQAYHYRFVDTCEACHARTECAAYDDQSPANLQNLNKGK